jgi:hypothetical protein
VGTDTCGFLSIDESQFSLRLTNSHMTFLTSFAQTGSLCPADPVIHAQTQTRIEDVVRARPVPRRTTTGPHVTMRQHRNAVALSASTTYAVLRLPRSHSASHISGPRLHRQDECLRSTTATRAPTPAISYWMPNRPRRLARALLDQAGHHQVLARQGPVAHLGYLS